MTTTEPASADGLGAVAELAAQLRVDSVGSSTSAGSGHPTSRMSAADLLAAGRPPHEAAALVGLSVPGGYGRVPRSKSRRGCLAPFARIGRTVHGGWGS
jgi:hypothetical protein